MNFRNIEALFAILIDQLKPLFSEGELAETTHFLDVGEYGLALETAIDICREEKKCVTLEVKRIVNQLASAMELDPQALVDRLSQ
jgi:hypothetical protein